MKVLSKGQVANIQSKIGCSENHIRWFDDYMAVSLPEQASPLQNPFTPVIWLNDALNGLTMSAGDLVHVQLHKELRGLTVVHPSSVATAVELRDEEVRVIVGGTTAALCLDIVIRRTDVISGDPEKLAATMFSRVFGPRRQL